MSFKNDEIEKVNSIEKIYEEKIKVKEIDDMLSKLLSKLKITEGVVSEKELNSLNLDPELHDLFCYYIGSKGLYINYGLENDGVLLNDDYVKQYFKEIGQYKLLTPQEEQELGEK